MVESPEYARYRSDVAVLVEIGRQFAAQLPYLDVMLPRHLVEAAIAAWDRDEEGTVGDETAEQRRVRHLAGDLALLGLAFSDPTRPTPAPSTHVRAAGDEVAVRLPVAHVAAAVIASVESAEA